MKFLLDHDVPDDTAYGLEAMGHEVFKLRDVIDPQTTDEAVLRFAGEHDYVLITCNRDDFLAAARVIPHVGSNNPDTSKCPCSRARSFVAPSG